MGNGNSQPKGLIIENDSYQTDNFWSLHNATYGSNPPKRVTVFMGPSDATEKLTALEKFSKNLMLYRHPCILKYEASWKVNGQYHLATEEVQPLSQVLHNQASLQICIGLHSIVRALNFLHEKALSSHNNVCQASIFVTSEGNWKLGGLEYLCPFSKISGTFLAENRNGRYERCIAPDESKRVPQPVSAIDVYAFGILVEEILAKNDDDVPGMREFVEISRMSLQTKDCSSRPTFCKLLQHPFFSHDFIKIHGFLSEIPVKSEEDKKEFFSNLAGKLRLYNEELVASQLGGLLLSRMVILDSTAQALLLPKLLKPRNDENPESLFSEETFQNSLAPRLLSIFYVRDLQIRLTLLSYFSHYCHTFTPNQLQTILPEILLGIKDTNDLLVSATLVALSLLVPILGSAKVIGGKRMKLFSDGRPMTHSRDTSKESSLPVIPTSNESDIIAVEERILSERHSPDGGEMLSSTTLLDTEDTWNVWDNQASSNVSLSPSPTPLDDNLLLGCEQPQDHSLLSNSMVDSDWGDTAMNGQLLSLSTGSSTTAISGTSMKTFTPIENLDLKTIEMKPVKKSSIEEVDFFSDMEPVISKASVLRLISDDEDSVNRFSLSSAGGDAMSPEGWGDDIEWADVNDANN